MTLHDSAAEMSKYPDQSIISMPHTQKPASDAHGSLNLVLSQTYTRAREFKGSPEARRHSCRDAITI